MNHHSTDDQMSMEIIHLLFQDNCSYIVNNILNIIIILFLFELYYNLTNANL